MGLTRAVFLELGCPEALHLLVRDPLRRLLPELLLVEEPHDIRECGLRLFEEKEKRASEDDSVEKLHVAHSFVSALTCYRVHRGVGIVAAISASLIGISTLFSKQHYILDVIAGILLACAAYAVFLRTYPRNEIPDLDRRLAPVFALCIIGVVVLALAGFWVAYQLSGEA